MQNKSGLAGAGSEYGMLSATNIGVTTSHQLQMNFTTNESGGNNNQNKASPFKSSTTNNNHSILLQL